MKLVRSILLAVVALAALGASGCFINFDVPDPPDIQIHGEINGEGGNGEVETDDGFE